MLLFGDEEDDVKMVLCQDIEAKEEDSEEEDEDEDEDEVEDEEEEGREEKEEEEKEENKGINDVESSKNSVIEREKKKKKKKRENQIKNDKAAKMVEAKDKNNTLSCLIY